METKTNRAAKGHAPREGHAPHKGHGPSSYWMQPPKEVFEVLGLKAGDRVLDLGCGAGDYANIEHTKGLQQCFWLQVFVVERLFAGKTMFLEDVITQLLVYIQQQKYMGWFGWFYRTHLSAQSIDLSHALYSISVFPKLMFISSEVSRKSNKPASN